jgi:hypothetical protein
MSKRPQESNLFLTQFCDMYPVMKRTRAVTCCIHSLVCLAILLTFEKYKRKYSDKQDRDLI